MDLRLEKGIPFNGLVLHGPIPLRMFSLKKGVPFISITAKTRPQIVVSFACSLNLFTTELQSDMEVLD